MAWSRQKGSLDFREAHQRLRTDFREAHQRLRTDFRLEIARRGGSRTAPTFAGDEK